MNSQERASARVAQAGEPPWQFPNRWRVTWRLKQFLGEEYDSKAVATAARGIHDRLEKYRVRSFGSRWADTESGDNYAAEEIARISAKFHTIGYVDGDESAELGYFNLLMNNLYDWADAERVIIG
jgi:hypothetical protein